MRAASSGEQGIKRVSDKGDVAYATNQTARRRARLAGRKRVTYRRWEAVNDPGDARVGRATGVWPNSSDHYAGRIRSANSPFGNIKIAVGPKLQATRIIQSGGKDRDVGWSRLHKSIGSSLARELSKR